MPKIAMHNLMTDYNMALVKTFYCFSFVHCFCNKTQTCKIWDQAECFNQY